MDNYQRAFLGDLNFLGQITYGRSIHVESDDQFDCETDTFEVRQNEEEPTAEYEVRVRPYPFIEKVLSLKNGEWEEASLAKDNSVWSKESYCIKVDFDDPTEKIKIVFKHGSAKDLIITLKYIPVSKEVYAEKARIKREADFLSKVSIKCWTGENLVNIFFQPCCEEVAKTEIDLYVSAANAKWQLFKKVSLSKDDLFFSMGDLAYGTYSYILRQLNEKGEILFESNRDEFRLSKPIPRRL